MRGILGRERRGLDTLRYSTRGSGEEAIHYAGDPWEGATGSRYGRLQTSRPTRPAEAVRRLYIMRGILGGERRGLDTLRYSTRGSGEVESLRGFQSMEGRRVYGQRRSRASEHSGCLTERRADV